MEWILLLLILLLIPSVFFATRFFCIKKNIRDAKVEIEELLQNPDANRILKFSCPDKNFESFLMSINQYLQFTRKERIQYLRREIEIRKEIENISHDLRTPLTSILGYIELIDRKALSDDERDYLEVVIRKSKSLQRLIGKFYDLSRLEADEYAFENRTVNIHKMLSELLLNSYNEFDKKGINIDLNIGNREVNVLGDEDALERIFTNLINNVLKYATNNLWVSIEAEKNKVVVKFVNDTLQLSDIDVYHMFDRFYMKDEARTNHSTGLGLTITKLLVEKMGGNISADLDEDEKLEIRIEFSEIEM
ncbi:sensor histidine kinase [[Clostridium] fimetarium]|uniref:histidine kinase n=1 Tax=[Clostridium] fimetarium TaxID=99656 RepID=A0A1I0RL01_9FIRM|nr:HAMP domain-containing sensor histidine kinase [[Clostridium] fimetarium]SEW41526.1 hypothetical protein SAMN05421659_11765 [[Clostridium] fimetarium]